LTRAEQRGGVPCGGSLFLIEAGLDRASIGTAPALEGAVTS
jgi:hypothetical protein